MRNLIGIRLDGTIEKEEKFGGEYRFNVQKYDNHFVRIELSNTRNGIYMEIDPATANWLGFELARLTLDEAEDIDQKDEES